MKTYKVTYVETLVYEFYVYAENEAEAEKKFLKGAQENEFDFDRGWVAESDYSIEEATR